MAGVCVAGMAAMKHAFNAVRTGEHQSAVAVASECASAIMRSENFTSEVTQKQLDNAKPEIGFEKDFLRWMLSDGAGAVQLSNRPNESGLSFKIDWIELTSYANEMPVCMYAGGEVQNGQFVSWKSVPQAERDAKSFMAIKQDVKLLNENIVKYTVEKALSKLIEKYDLKAEDIDYFLPHYSSDFFRDRLLCGLRNINFEIAQEMWQYGFCFYLYYFRRICPYLSAQSGTKSVMLCTGERSLFKLFYVVRSGVTFHKFLLFI